MRSSLRILRFAAFCGVVTILMIPLAGCMRRFHEELIMDQAAGPTAPDWVVGDPQNQGSGEDVFFVGRSVGYTVLDEPAAVDAAREDILSQIAELISTRVTSASHRYDERENPESDFHVPRHHCGVNGFTPFDDDRFMRFLAGPEHEQLIEREACLFTTGIAGELIDRGTHFEKWEVREEPVGYWGRARRGLVRWKCWLLMSIPKDKLERRIEDFRRLVWESYDRYIEERERELAHAEEERQTQLGWVKEDREIRIRREEEDRAWARADQTEDREEARELREKIMARQRDVKYEVSGTH